MLGPGAGAVLLVLHAGHRVVLGVLARLPRPGHGQARLQAGAGQLQPLLLPDLQLGGGLPVLQPADISASLLVYCTLFSICLL